MIRSIYTAFVGCGWVSPVEFWKLRPGEVWMIWDAHKSEIKSSGTDFGELYDILKGGKNGAS